MYAGPTGGSGGGGAGQFRSDGRGGGEGWSSAGSRGVRVYKQAASFCRLFRSY